MSKDVEDTIVKIITIDKKNIPEIEKALESSFNVVPTSKLMFDEEKKKWYGFIRLFKKVKQ